MNEEDLKNLKDLRFTFTKEMQEMIDKLLSMRYILDNEKLSNRKKAKLEKELTEFKEKVTKTFGKEIQERGCVGSIAEIYDSKKPYLPKGAIAQAWSVAEVFRIILGR